MLCIEGWARDGLTDEQIARKMGISAATFYNWQNRFVEIFESVKRGKAPVDVEVENALLKRALGFEYVEEVTEIEDVPTGKIDGNGNPIMKKKKHLRKVKKVVPPDPVSMIFWLKNRKPATWRDKPEPPVSNEVMDRLEEVLDSIKGVV